MQTMTGTKESSFINTEFYTDNSMNPNSKLSLLRESISDETDIYHSDRTFKNNLKKLEKINPKNFKFIDFLFDKRLEDNALTTLNRYCYVYFKHLDTLEIEKLNKNFLGFLLSKIKISKYADATKKKEWSIIKQIVVYLDLEVNLSVFKMRFKAKKLKYDDLLTKEEKSLILNSNINLEKKVFFNIMFDGGLRVGEAFSIERKSFTEIEDGYLVEIYESKTTLRTIFVFNNVKWIKELLKTTWQKWTFGYPMTRKVLGRFKKKFGGKRIYNHLARHTRTTELYPFMKDLELAEYMGWSSTKMINEVYAHIQKGTGLQKVMKLEKQKKLDFFSNS